MESNRIELAALVDRERETLCRTMARWMAADPALAAAMPHADAWWERRARILLHHFILWLQGWSPHGPEWARAMLAPARLPRIFRSSILETLDDLGALSREARSDAGRLIDHFTGSADPAAGAAPAPQAGVEPGQNAPDAPRRTRHEV
jgi:hypothetical protein